MKDYPWFKNYPEGIPKEINPDQFGSLAELFENSFQKYADLEAYENMGKTLTFKEVDLLSKDMASFFINHLGLKKGDRVAIQMPNLLQYPVVLFAVLRAGLIVVNTNPLYTAREMEHQFKDSGAKAIVILSNFAANLQKVKNNTDIEHIVVTNVGDLLGGLKGPLINFAVKHIKKMVPAYDLPGAISFKEALAIGKKKRFERVEIDREDLAFLQYTGGTTGVSKGAMLTHRNLLANLAQVGAWMQNHLQERKEVVITPLPLYHVFALTCNCLVMTNIGAKNILITNPREMPKFLKELNKHPFTAMTGVNTLFNGLLNQPDFAKINFSHLKVAFGGGMAVQKVVAEKWKKTTNTPLVEGYGLTETSPVLTANPLDGTEVIGSIGLPIPSTEIIIVDEDFKEVGFNEPGEICARGPQVMKGYWNRDDESGKVFKDGWFKTGDIGTIDEGGYVRIVDRKKEMINVSGFNVYPNEVEEVVAAHPKVLEVGAIGVPDEKSTEVVKVFVVKKDESLTEEEVIAYCKENLTGYKVPRYVAFKDELPKSNVGKILRRILKEEDQKAATAQA